MADGYTRIEGGEVEEVRENQPAAQAARQVIETLQEVLARDGVQPILVPYSFPDLPLLEQETSQTDVADQLLEATQALDETLDVSFARDWVMPPAGRLDASSLEALQAADVSDGIFFSYESLRPLDPTSGGCPEPALSFVCPVRVETNLLGEFRGYIHDPDLQERLVELTGPGAGRLEIQRVLAETAMIHAELPGITGRVLNMRIPAIWQPRPSMAGGFFTALRKAPWLNSHTPSDGLIVADSIARREVVDEAPLFPLDPGAEYFGEIAAAEDLVSSYANFIAGGEQRQTLQRMRRNVLVAEGQSLWAEPDGFEIATSYAVDTRAEAESEMSKVELGVPNETTFTSRAGQLDVSLFNQTGYPVDVEVRLESLDMVFDPDTVERTFAPGTTRLSVQAEAQTSGTFPIQLRVLTEDGRTVASESIQVRSTEFNVVAVAITLGAVAFLILFYVMRAVFRRRRRNPAEASST
jgi:Family of unknown function (DUF6049)